MKVSLYGLLLVSGNFDQNAGPRAEFGIPFEKRRIGFLIHASFTKRVRSAVNVNGDVSEGGLSMTNGVPDYYFDGIC